MTTPASPRQVLLDLADRCEREEPSRQLDREIAAALGYGVQVIEIDDEQLPEIIEYKYTRGGWGNVEIDRFGNITPNRKIKKGEYSQSIRLFYGHC